MRLWAKPIPPKNICFKTLRATFGTVACEVAGGTDFAKVVLGHASQKTTEKHYIAARAARLHDLASKVSFGVKPPTATDAILEQGGDEGGAQAGVAPVRAELGSGIGGVGAPATYPALTRSSPEKNSAGIPSGFTAEIPADFAGGVYGTRIRTESSRFGVLRRRGW